MNCERLNRNGFGGDPSWVSGLHYHCKWFTLSLAYIITLIIVYTHCKFEELLLHAQLLPLV